MKSKILSSIVALIISSHPVCWAEVPDFLKRWGEDPISASFEIPEKQSTIRRRALFDANSIEKRQFVIIKDQFRSKSLCTESEPGKPCSDGTQNKMLPLEAMGDEWRLKQFLDTDVEMNLLKLDSFNEGRVAVLPWTGYYWPVFEGGIGNRYADSQFPRSKTFKDNYEYYERNYLQKPDPDRDFLEKLSPAEKYDYILNDRNWRLTQAVWADGKYYLDTYGKVENWMGICHGWAPASFVVPEPKKTISLTLENHRGELTVYPHDLKALVSQLWARAPVKYQSLGGRCRVKYPEVDSGGRIISPECFDVNPSQWHLVLTHLLGREQKTFVMDATYDYEVWNQPLFNYTLKYFNPNTRDVGTMRESIIPYADVSRDVYQSYRSPNVRYLVGVISEVRYIVEEYPYPGNITTNAYGRLMRVSYYYDLELDRNYNIIGGEWYQKAHPDMLWKPLPGSRPYIKEEDKLSDWHGRFPVPQDIMQLGLRFSSYKIPLSKILDELINRSKE